MQRRYELINSLAIGRPVQVLAFGHYGAPVIAFPSGGGQFFDFESNGMITAVAPLIEAGKIKIYCPESLDNESWLNQGIDPHWRAVRHNAYQDFILYDLVPAIRADCHDENIRIALTGASLGAYHAANFALKFPHLFHYALCMSGRYDLEAICGHSGSQEVYFNNPLAYVPNLHDGDLDHVRHNTHLLSFAVRVPGKKNACAKPIASPTCWPKKASVTNETSGATMWNIIGFGGGSKLPTILARLLDDLTWTSQNHKDYGS